MRRNRGGFARSVSEAAERTTGWHGLALFMVVVVVAAAAAAAAVVVVVVVLQTRVVVAEAAFHTRPAAPRALNRWTPERSSSTWPR